MMHRKGTAYATDALTYRKKRNMSECFHRTPVREFAGAHTEAEEPDLDE